MPADVTVVVITYNSSHVVEGLLDSLPAALDGMPADVVVVDNGSTDDTREVVAARDDVRLVASTNTGYAGGLNTGAAAAPDTPAILVLNPDARLAPRAARLLVERLGGRTGITAPRVLGADGHLQLSLRREPTIGRASGLAWTKRPALSEYVQDERAYEIEHDVDWALGAVLAVSRACYDALGGWDESYFLYSEETDFCLRARDLGWVTTFVPGAGAIHIGAQSGTSPEIHAMQILNRVRLYRRRQGTLRASAYYAVTVLSELSWWIRGHRQSRHAVTTLLRPSTRPVQLPRDPGLIPR